MYRIDRGKRSRIAKEIVREYSIRTHNEFANAYTEYIKKKIEENQDTDNTEYEDQPEYISRTTAGRMIKDAGISLSYETGRYEYHAKPIKSAPTPKENLADMLTFYSFGIVLEQEENLFFLISVDFGYEHLISELIFQAWNTQVYVLLGHGCLQLIFTNDKSYRIVKRFFNLYKRSD